MKTNQQIRFLILITSTVVLVACQSPVQEVRTEQNMAAALDAPKPTYMYPFGSPAELADIMEWGRVPEGPERKKAQAESDRIALPGFQRGVNLFAQFEKDYPVSMYQAIRNAETSMEPYNGDESQFMAEQMLGYLLLNKFLAQDKITTVPPEALAQRELTREEQAAVGFATKLLNSNVYPNADLLAASLNTLEGFWTDSEIRTQAELAIDGAKAYLSRTACESCASKVSLTGQADRRQQIEEGIVILERLVQK